MKKFLVKKTAIIAGTISLFSCLIINNTAFAEQNQQQEPKQNSANLSKPQAGFYYFQVGDIKVTALSDGSVVLNTKLLNNEDNYNFDKLLKESYSTHDINASINSYLIELKDKLILVDAGSGTFLSPTANKLQNSLKNSGYAPEQITDIVITHFHSDHIGGLISNDKILYPNATLHLNKKEADYWLNAELYKKAPEHIKKNFENANKVITPYIKSGQVKFFEGNNAEEIKLFDGLTAITAKGHTAGHTFYSIESKGEKLMFLGDTMHIPQIQLPQPDVTIQFDSDAKQAEIQRKKAFTDAAKNVYLVALSHMSFPGVGRLAKQNKGYKWIPVPYINNYISEK